ncbi:DUF3122 domain-containing protein [Cyanobium sp. ATX 6A2]|jgi:hypothetical protein|uniref:DUF3122 domain-containing protein n=1 Tax=Cyanobium sp. ATX 6A2 TaxID=2823700 RepID=UPI0020CC8A65|nr:DUF3122 domain-containing protein [Cyanobium sp. ATX 6A2]MCP9888862.1 DUF3122 domain-containing protein [Cyanobium sp. ATX 6A2]
MPLLLRAALSATLCLVCLLAGLALAAAPAAAQLHAHSDEQGRPVLRSLESLRDLDYQSWQLVAYREGPPGGALKLRIVGYPGKVRLDHPTALAVRSGRRHWQLADLTLANPQLAADGRSAAAEFDLSPLIAELSQNRPLRLFLPGVFTELPVPPFVVAEWRSLVNG